MFEQNSASEIVYCVKVIVFFKTYSISKNGSIFIMFVGLGITISVRCQYPTRHIQSLLPSYNEVYARNP